MKMKYFEDINIGTKSSKSMVYEVSKDEIMEFASRWDTREFHLDENAAASSVFGGIVACSAHVFSILSWFGTHGGDRTASLAALGFDEFRLHCPIRPGDRLTYAVTYLEKRESRSKPDRGIVRYLVELANQNCDVAVSLIATTLVAKRSSQ